MTFWHNDSRPAFLPSDYGFSWLRRLCEQPDASTKQPVAPMQPVTVSLNGPVLCVSRSGALDSVTSWLRAQGVVCDHASDLTNVMQDAQADGRRWSMLLLAVDDVGGILEVIDQLLVLRRKVPWLPVMLFSSEVCGDDLSTVRQMLCDATLRLPVGPARFGPALTEAGINNRLWIDRRAATRL